jgi:pyruvate/2-oxoglutarate dehydrogenase complex dihydrolipoamide acyltransferase (E2) component
MTEPMLFPKLNEAGDDGTVDSWLVTVGDTIGEDTPIMIVEMEKASVELESSIAGIVKQLLVEPGEIVRVGQPILEVE